MIFKVVFPDRYDYVQAKSVNAMQQGYKKEIGDEFLSVKEVHILSKEVAKNIILKDTEGMKGMSLLDVVVGVDFCVVASTEWE